MAAISLVHPRPLNRWDYDSIRPGVTSSVGDCLVGAKLKSSLPGDFRWDSFHNDLSLGSNVQDGYSYSYTSGGGPPRTFDSNWQSGRDFKHQYGYKMQNLRNEDRLVEPVLGSLGDYSWKNKIARVEGAKKTGNLFKFPQEGLIKFSGLPRGGLFPRVTDVAGGVDVPLEKVNAGPPQTSPNYKPHLSSFGGDPEESRKHINKGPTVGRHHR